MRGGCASLSPASPGIAAASTLVGAGLLVSGVGFLFLPNWRATLIPIIAVPVSLIGTFAGLWLFGLSINTLTLFAIVLAIGLVVDDPIIFLETVERLLADPGIVRNRLKIESAIHNARAFLRVQEEFGSFSEYVWRFVDGETIQNLSLIHI
mgnify:CR=1 FL=1